MWAFMKGKRMSDVSNSVAPVGVAATAPPVAATVPVPPVAVRVATPAERSVFGPNVKFDASGNPIEAGIGALIADVKEAVQKVEDFVASLEPAKPVVAAVPVPLVVAMPAVSTVAASPTPVPPATPPIATAAGVAAVKAAIATAPRANRADMIAKLKALEAELAASSD